MTAVQALPLALGVIATLLVSTLALIAIVKALRGRNSVRSKSLLAPYRSALIAMASGEDEDGHAKSLLYSLPAPTWALLRESVLAFLPKVRGSSADDLSDLMRFHGEIDRATSMVASRRAVRRAGGAYLLGLTRDRHHAPLLVPLLRDHDPDVRLVAARALGVLGEPLAASAVLGALSVAHRGQIGLPAWVAAEALLAMGTEITATLKAGLSSPDAVVRNVCAMVAGHGTFASTVPQLRVLLDTDSEADVRASAAVALGQIGGAGDVASLARLTDVTETTVLRRIAATALGDLGVSESLDTLAGLLGDGDPRLARLAADSLVRIGPHGIGKLEDAILDRSSARIAGAALHLAGLRGELVATARGA